jgi:hypothetical protein
MTGEREYRPAVDDLVLQHLELAKSGAGRTQRRAKLPCHQIGACGVCNDTVVVAPGADRAGADQQMAASTSWIGEGDWIAPGLAAVLQVRR